MMEITTLLITLLLSGPINILPVAANTSNVASKSADQLTLSPISNLQESLTASAAHGTVAVVQTFPDETQGDEENSKSKEYVDCAVILSRTPPQEASKAEEGNGATPEKDPFSSPCKDRTEKEIHSSPLLPIHTQKRLTVSTPQSNTNTNTPQSPLQQQQHPPPHLQLFHDQSLLLAMTGFYPDLWHLFQTVAKYTTTERTLIDSGPKAIDIVRNVLTEPLRDGALIGGSRPFGVQALLVESNASSKRSRNGKGGTNMACYTVDPAGNWVHWGGGATCIGHEASMVRRELWESLKPVEGEVGGERKGRPATWNQALEVAMHAMIKVFHVEGKNILGDDLLDERQLQREFSAMVLFGKCNDLNSSYPACAMIDGSYLHKIYLRSVSTFKQKPFFLCYCTFSLR